MKKLIPVVLGVWVIALVGCTTTTDTATTTQRQPNATMDPSTMTSRTERMPNRGPR